ncbi:MAG: alginate export family protein [Elusimicrobiota bacterium]
MLKGKNLIRGIWFAFIVVSLGVVQTWADITFSGEFRLRPEYKKNADFNKATKDTQSFVGSRLRISGAGLAAEDIAVKVTFQDTRNWGEEPGSGAVNGLTDSGEAIDIHEGFVDFQNFLKTPFSFRAGRQELSFGDQRLIGSFGWNNQGRAFDAFRLMYVGNQFMVDAWTAKRKENNATTAGVPSNDRDFSGIYGTMKPVFPGALLDVYFLHDREGDTTGNAEPKNVYTYGLRLSGKNGFIDYTVEAPFQFGQNGTVVGVSSDSVKISANALAAKVGFTIPGDKEIRFGTEYDYASGDDNLSDTKAKTFNNLYPTNHLFYGYMDYQGWRNLSAWNANLSFKPQRPWFLSIHYWVFNLAEEKDGWYNAAGTASGSLRAASSANTEKNIGQEIDLLARFTQSSRVIWEFGYSRFFAGDLIDQRVANDSASDWAYVMSTIKF